MVLKNRYVFINDDLHIFTEGIIILVESVPPTFLLEY